jgi:hypothetical protein
VSSAGSVPVGRKRRFPVLAPKAEDRPPGTDGVVVDPFDFALLPIVELKLLPDVPAFRDEANLLDEGNDISGADPRITLNFLSLSHGP